MLKFSLILNLFFLFLFFPSVSAANLSEDYPLIGWQTFGGAVDDFYARFDLISSRIRDTERARRIKSLNPNIKIMFIEDWNVGCGITSPPSEWVLKNSGGTAIDSGYGSMMNLSKYSPRATAGAYLGKTYQEVCSDIMTSIDFSEFYGVFTDGVWGKDQFAHPDGPFGFWYQWQDIDMDNNGINDHSEVGAGKKWSDVQIWANEYQQGLDTLLRLIREKMDAKAPGRPITLNVGSPFSWGRQWINGFEIEKFGAKFDDAVTDWYAQRFQQQASPPYTSIADGLVDPGDPEKISNPLREARDHLKAMRFGLVTAMFNDLYFSFQDPDEGNPHSRTPDDQNASQEHYWSFWYDEFESSLGKPTASAQELKTGVGYRCFEKGMALANIDGRQQTINRAELTGLCGYSGEYYRLKSGQDLALGTLDPQWEVLHDGSLFSAITLRGVRWDSFGLTVRRGDGLILLRQPQTVVADIIIDNNYMSTSPTNRLMESYGFIQEEDCGAGSDYYTVRCSWNKDSFAYAYAQPGSATAVFIPTIGVAGQYEVFEWHGFLQDNQLASNATYIINYSGGTVSKIVNQQTNTGKWNSLGNYYFNAGTSGKVTISARGLMGP